MKYQAHYQSRVTSQSQPIPGREAQMVANQAGGFVYPVDDWVRLTRFLILGNEGGSYYADEQKMTRENAGAVQRCIVADGAKTVQRIVEISEGGRAPKNDAAIFCLAMCAAMGDDRTRAAAFEALPRVARIGTHLFSFLDAVQGFRGWGRGLRKAVGRWYTEKATNALAYQLVKYRQRGGWTHRDALRLAHPAPTNGDQQNIFCWLTKGELYDGMPKVLEAYVGLEAAKSAGWQEAVKAIRDCPTLPWEAVPTEFLGQKEVWEALLPNLPMTATIRNLGRMTSNGLLRPMSAASKVVVERITNAEQLKKARVHPIAILAALLTYQRGKGMRGNLSWEPVREIVDALDAAFYLSFGNVESIGKPVMLALDVSGSMEGGTVAGVEGLTPRVASAALALITANVESQYVITAFSSAGTNLRQFGNRVGWRRGELSELSISPRQRLDDVVRAVSGLDFGGTDCALPMLYALDRQYQIDGFVIYTDNETWAGDIHPSQALVQYRQRMNVPAKLAVCGMVANSFSIADPNDAGMMDVVGFSTDTPQLISDFIR